MHDSIWYPSQKIQRDILMGGQDVAQIGAIDDVFEGRENADPDGRPVVGRNISGVAVLASLRNHPCSSRVGGWRSAPQPLFRRDFMLTRHSGNGARTNLLAA